MSARPTPGVLAAFTALATCYLAAAASGQTVIYVNATAQAGGNGSSWATPYNNLSIALSAAASLPASAGFIEVWIARGKYVPAIPAAPTDPRSARFSASGGTGIGLYGGFAGNESSKLERLAGQNETVLSGDLAGNDPEVIAWAALNDEPPSFYSDNCYCVAEGVKVYDTLTIRGGNNALPGDVVEHSAGAAIMQLAAPNALVNNVLFRYNRSGNGVPGWYNTTSCTVVATGDAHGDVVFSRCRFFDNTSRSGWGAIAVNHVPQQANIDTCFIVNSVFAHNGTGTLRSDGSGLPKIAIWYSTFVDSGVGNNTPEAAGLTDLSITASLFLDSDVRAYRNVNGGALRLDYCGMNNSGVFMFNGIPGNPSVAHGTAGPVFVDPTGYDFHLALPGPIDQGPPDGSYTGQPIARYIVSDADSRRRFFDTSGTVPARSDPGAFEYQSPYWPSAIFVTSGTGGAQDGLSWSSAVHSIQSAESIASGTFGVVPQIWVAGGTYKPSLPLAQGGSRSSSFVLQSGLAIYGGFAGNETLLSQRSISSNPTILSGDLNGDDNGSLNRDDNSYHVVVGTGVDRSGVLDGFTIRGGQADYNTTPLAATSAGGGLYCDLNGSPTVRLCTFEQNNASFGAAVAHFQASIAHYEACIFQNNHALGASAGNGGAIHLYAYAGSSPTVSFTDCVFENNSAAQNGGALAVVNGARAIAIRSRFRRNTADMSGGGVFAVGQLDLVSCRLEGNVAWYGAGAHVKDSTSTFQQCSVVGNSAIGSNGGGVYVDNSTVTFTCCDVVANRHPLANFGGAGVWESGIFASVTIRNSILWGNESPSGIALFASQFEFWGNPGRSISYCTIQGLGGSYGLDPTFVRSPSPGPDNTWGTADDDYGDLHVGLGSPVIDSGDATAVPADVYDIDGNGNTTESLPLDLDDRARFYDYALIANTGVGSPPVDRGCYEFTPPDTSMPGDRRWINPAGGLFGDLFNWYPGIPGAVDGTVFDILGSYTVTWPSSSLVYNRTATVRNGSVAMNLSGQTYSLTSAIEASLVVGDVGGQPAALTISNGRINAVEARIGSTAGSIGTVNVAGSGNAASPSAFLATTEGLCIGCQGTGTLNVTGGARASCLFGFLGEQSGATGQLNVTGPGSRFDAPFFLAIDNGNVNVSNGGLLTTGAFGTIYLFPNGTISGDGTIQGHVVNFGTISPGNSPGTLTINGGYDQVGTIDNLNNISGHLQSQISGPASSQYDRLMVNGAATLGGGLVVSLMDGYQPAGADQFQLVSASGGLVKPFDVVFFPALASTGGAGRYMRALYSGLRGPGTGGVTINLGNLASTPTFSNPASFNLASQPSGVAIADLDGDGLLDVAVTIPDPVSPSAATGAVAILHNSGGSGQNWQGFSLSATIPVGLNPVAAAAARLDPASSSSFLVIANSASSTLSIIKNSGGPGGSYSVIATQATDPEPVSIAAADFNGLNAATTMLAVACAGGPGASTGSLSLLANATSPGGNVALVRRSLPAPIGHRPVHIQPHNPDQDKDLDLAVALEATDGSSDAIAVYINGHDPGAPVQSPDIFNITSAAVMIPVGAGPSQLVSGRLAPVSVSNPAGKHEDLISVNTAGNSISVLVNTSTVQDQPAFSPAVDYHFEAAGQGASAPSAPRSAALVDLDASGTLDLAVIASNPSGTNRIIKVLRNDSTINLGLTQLAFAQQADVPAGSKPLAIVSGDVDGDGQVDLVTINSTLGRDGPNTLQVIKNALPPPAMSGGACCSGAACFLEIPSRCVSTNQRFAGIGTACNAPADWRAPCCRADFDHSGATGVTDIFAFLSAWFSSSPQADINSDALDSVQDIFDFMAAWFNGC